MAAKQLPLLAPNVCQKHKNVSSSELVAVHSSACLCCECLYSVVHHTDGSAASLSLFQCRHDCSALRTCFLSGETLVFAEPFHWFGYRRQDAFY